MKPNTADKNENNHRVSWSPWPFAGVFSFFVGVLGLYFYKIEMNPIIGIGLAVLGAFGVGGSITGAILDISKNFDNQRPLRNRSLAIFAIVALLIIIFYAMTIVRLGGNVLNRPM